MPSTIPPLHERLALNRWFLNLSGKKNFEELADILKDPDYLSEGIGFFGTLKRKKIFTSLSANDLEIYNENIERHTQTINQRRARPIYWKYFQYLALLFTEIYLHQYFQDKNEMINELNKILKNNNDRFQTEYNLHLPQYTASDLSKIAFWMATGSGKTLIMHINILQYLHYVEKYNQQRKLNKIILLTPNSGLSHQHLNEFKQSNIDARIFDKNNNALDFVKNKPVEIIEVTKLDEKMGDTKVAVDSFEENNLVLVDEGHRGSSGEAWMKHRKSLTKNGFSFEYSATFGQAFGANNDDLTREYAKCILFDYSYKFFYDDGYGKDFHILNFSNNEQNIPRQIYLTACLLSFYQQILQYTNEPDLVKKYNIAKPLWVFIGHSVQAVRQKDKKNVSDVLDIILFLSSFLNNPEQSKQCIRSILNNTHGLQDSGKDIFENKFDYLKKSNLKKNHFDDIKECIFNAQHQGKLHVEYISSSEEITLKIENNPPFGVINVGDASKLKNLCEEKSNGEFIVANGDRIFSQPYFDNINKPNSNINILIGAKKFIEGWNSWRVATMGLMNVGRTEGTQSIQLFGRGVRLKGENLSLRRSGENTLKNLETLNIFGVRSDYMRQFSHFLLRERVSSKQRIPLPVILNFKKERKLKVLCLPDGISFKGSAEYIDFDHERGVGVILDLHPRIRQQSSGRYSPSDINEQNKKSEVIISDEDKSFIDIDQIYLELEKIKQANGWCNVNITTESIKKLLNEDDWYTLYVLESQKHFEDFGKAKLFWQTTLFSLMKKYFQKLYRTRQSQWEQKNLQYKYLQEKDANLLWSTDAQQHQYILDIDLDKQELIDKIAKIGKAILEGKAKDINWKNFINFENHLYQPLIKEDKDGIAVKPCRLNEGEINFVNDLMKYVKNDKDVEGKEFYLLRNQSRSGIGFFETSYFYPDFILWILCNGKQYINFIDPHGLMHVNTRNEEKIEFHKKIKEIESHLGENDVVLNSFILSVTRFNKLELFASKKEAESKNVFFMKDDRDYLKKIIDKIVFSQQSKDR